MKDYNPNYNFRQNNITLKTLKVSKYIIKYGKITQMLQLHVKPEIK